MEHGIPVVEGAAAPFGLPVGVACAQPPGIEVDVVLGKVDERAGIGGAVCAGHALGAYQWPVAQTLEAIVHRWRLLVEAILTTVVMIVVHIHQTLGVFAQEALSCGRAIIEVYPSVPHYRGRDRLCASLLLHPFRYLGYP